MQVTTPKKKFKITTIIYILSFAFSFYYMDFGFAFKPFMFLSFIIFLTSIKKFAIKKSEFYESIMILFFLYYTLTSAWASYPEYSLRLVLGIWLMIFCYFLMRYLFSRTDLEIIEKGISMSGLVFNVYSLFLFILGWSSIGFTMFGNKIKSYGVLIDRNTPRLIGMASDPNIFVFYNLIFFFYYITHLDKKWSKVGLLLSSATIILTQSRGGFLALGVGLIVLFILSDNKKKIKLIVLAPIFLLILSFFTKKFLNINFIDLSVSRFETIDGGSGRVNIWKNGLHIFKNNPIGIGAFNFRPYSQKVFGIGLFMHNTFLEVLVESGIIGFMLYILLFGAVFKGYFDAGRYIKDNKFLLCTFISLTLMLLSLSMLVNEIFFLVLALLGRYFEEAKYDSNVN